MVGLVRDISSERPLVINSYDQLCEVVKTVLADAGLIKKEELPVVPVQTEYNGKQVSKILLAKGYHAKSYKGWKRVLDDNGIAGIERGREMWYPAGLVDAIPTRQA